MVVALKLSQLETNSQGTDQWLQSAPFKAFKCEILFLRSRWLFPPLVPLLCVCACLCCTLPPPQAPPPTPRPKQPLGELQVVPSLSASLPGRGGGETATTGSAQPRSSVTGHKNAVATSGNFTRERTNSLSTTQECPSLFVRSQKDQLSRACANTSAT